MFTSTRPRSPHPDIGRVYALNNHGVVVYLTRDENFFFVLLIVFMVAFLGLFAAVVISSPRKEVGE